MGIEDKLEDTRVTLRARVASGKVTDTSCTFVMSFLEGPDYTTEFDNKEVPGTLDKGAATHELPLPKVRADDDTYMLKWKLKHEGREYLGDTSWKAFPRVITLTVKNEDGSKDLEGAGFAAKQGSVKPKRGQSTSAGKCEIPGLMAAKYDLDAEAPYEVVSWPKPKGRERTVWARRRPLTAEFVKPEPPDVHKQYVNAPASAGANSTPTVSVTVKPKDGTGKVGDKIFIKLTFAGSKRVDPDRKLLDAQTITGPTDDGTKKIWKGHLVIDDLTAGAPFRINLGQGGGDTCKVEISGATDAATKDPFPADATLEIENHRKIYFQLTRPATLPEPNMDRIKAAYLEAFILYERYLDVTIAENEGPKGSWHPGADIGSTATNCLIIGDHNKDTFHAKFRNDKRPLGAHVLYCHAQFDGGKAGANLAQPAYDNDITDTVAFPGGGTVPGFFVKAHDLLGGSTIILPKSVQKGTASVFDVKWTSNATTGAQMGKKGDIPEDHVAVNYVGYKADGGRFFIKFPSEAVAVINAGASINVKCKVSYVRGPYLGESDGAKPYLQLINADIAVNTQNDVMAHELGHTLGMVAPPAIPGWADPITDHGHKYDGSGHQGDHCGFGETPPFPPSMKGKAACKCIMYGENSGVGSKSNGHFCVKCLPILKALAFTKIQ
jgi:hypothetical protein